MKIDAHHHFVPDVLIAFMREHKSDFKVEIVEKDGDVSIQNEHGFSSPFLPSLFDIVKKLQEMEEMDIQMSVLSISPSFFFYDLDPKAALGAARICNDWVAETVRSHKEHFAGMATIPMQDTCLALAELKRAREELGIRALEIAPIVKGINLDDERFLPIFRYCAENSMLLYLHPIGKGNNVFYEGYHNMNLIGCPLETNVWLNHLIFGGIFEKFPELKVLASHGGGYFPYQFGRLMHGYKVRSEPKVHIPCSPEKYIGNIYYDTITHWGPSLQFLVDSFGADHCVLGTDYPYDMGDYEPVQKADALRITQAEREKIYSGNILKLLGM